MGKLFGEKTQITENDGIVTVALSDEGRLNALSELASALSKNADACKEIASRLTDIPSVTVDGCEFNTEGDGVAVVIGSSHGHLVRSQTIKNSTFRTRTKKKVKKKVKKK